MSRPHTFTILGPPVPKARARVTRSGHAFTPERTRNAEQFVRMTARTAGVVQRTGPIALTILFYEADRRRRDLDNMIKLVCDSLNPQKKDPFGAWLDDSQIVSLVAHRAYDPKRPCTIVTIADANGVEADAERVGMGETG